MCIPIHITDPDPQKFPNTDLILIRIHKTSKNHEIFSFDVKLVPVKTVDPTVLPETEPEGRIKPVLRE